MGTLVHQVLCSHRGSRQVNVGCALWMAVGGSTHLLRGAAVQMGLPGSGFRQCSMRQEPLAGLCRVLGLIQLLLLRAEWASFWAASGP